MLWHLSGFSCAGRCLGDLEKDHSCLSELQFKMGTIVKAPNL